MAWSVSVITHVHMVDLEVVSDSVSVCMWTPMLRHIALFEEE